MRTHGRGAASGLANAVLPLLQKKDNRCHVVTGLEESGRKQQTPEVAENRLQSQVDDKRSSSFK